MVETDLSVPAEDVARVLKATGGVHPQVAVVLGSGLCGLADAVDDAVSIPYVELPGFPSTGPLAGHAGRLVSGSVDGVPAVLFQGRAHLYQGVTATEAAYPARLAAALGCTTLLVTNAAGGVSDELRTGDLVVITDHLNLMAANPLVGWPGPSGGTPFVPMRDAYDPVLRAMASEVAIKFGIALKEGVYAGLLGPTYETPAEVAMLRTLGADVVGMSTVPEVIVARALGLKVLGFSLVTNTAAGEGLSHAEVLEAGALAGSTLTALVLGILRKL